MNRSTAPARPLPGTALFFTRSWQVVPPYVVHCIFRGNIVYERNIFISITRTDEPFGLEVRSGTRIADGLEAFEILAGFKELLDIENILKEHGIYEKIIFYGIEDIVTRNPLWHGLQLYQEEHPQLRSVLQTSPEQVAGGRDPPGNVSRFYSGCRRLKLVGGSIRRTGLGVHQFHQNHLDDAPDPGRPHECSP